MRHCKRRHTPCELIPAKELTPGKDNPSFWQAHSAEAHFIVVPKASYYFPKQYCLFKAILKSDNVQALSPVLRFVINQETFSIALPLPGEKGEVVCALTLPPSIQEVSFWVVKNPALIECTEVSFQEIGKLELLLRKIIERYGANIKDIHWYYGMLRKLYALYRVEGWQGVRRLWHHKTDCSPLGATLDLNLWYRNYYSDAAVLTSFAAHSWPENAPTISILMCVYNTKAEWLQEAIESVEKQIYPHWQLVCVNDASTEAHIKPLLEHYANKDQRIIAIHLDKNEGVANASNRGLGYLTGEIVCFMDHDDVLAPHACYRFADAFLKENPDILYSDEVITKENIHEISAVKVRPQFSYDYYLSHPFIVHWIGVRRTLLEEVKGFTPAMKVSQDVDLMLKLLEKATRITHVPDVLYCWRTHTNSLGHQQVNQVMNATKESLARHMKRLGIAATIENGKIFNSFKVNFLPKKKQKVAVVIPTKNLGKLLKQCIDSLEKTIPKELIDIFIIDHESEDPETLHYLKQLANKYHIIPYSGPFNFSKMNNMAIRYAKTTATYTHYLCLNNDIEALTPGWLEHMVMLASRKEVGIVGALLLYPDQRHIQHAGVILGMSGVAEHAYKGECYGEDAQLQAPKMNADLAAVREYSAVTAACLLIRADAFEAVKGYDENLAIGFGDTDLCLRVSKAGYKVLQDNHAILIHHESLSRVAEKKYLRHPEDTHLFLERYQRVIEKSDPYFSPFFSLSDPGISLASEKKLPLAISYRTVDLVLPQLE